MIRCESLHPCEHELDAWIVLPARGGSIGIPRKNLTLCAGKPLLQHIIETSTQVLCPTRIVVITDSAEIAEFAEFFGVSAILESEKSGPRETLDEKLFRNVENLRKLGAELNDYVLTLQPTSPLTTRATILQALGLLRSGYRTSITVANDSHLRWGIDEATGVPFPKFAQRLNRQQLPVDYRETGGVVGVRLADLKKFKTRIIEPVGIVAVPENESIDIDTYGNLFEAEHWLTRGKILIRVEANQTLGMGHLYRCLAIAYELARHEVMFLTSAGSPLAKSLLTETAFRIEVFETQADRDQISRNFQPDLVIFDILDTSAEEVSSMKDSGQNLKTITFEDEGDGAALCDLGIYDLTDAPTKGPSKTISGISNSILGPSFELYGRFARQVHEQDSLLLTFGGTDPSGLTQKVLDALETIGFQGKVTVVVGLGANNPDLSKLGFQTSLLRNVSNMATLISRHNRAISSMGRTVFELASMGVPSLTFAQNAKELSHVHVGEGTGSIAGGPGFSMSVDEIAGVIDGFLGDSELLRGLVQGAEPYRLARSNQNVIRKALVEIGLGQMSWK